MESPWGERDWQYYTDYSELPLCILQLDPADRAVIRIADERDAVQKKTFTKWVNKHLLKAGRKILDLYEDLRDGHNLISLLEVLAHDILPRERGHMRFHKIQNVQIALDFLRMKGIKLVNIRSDEIVDGNPKLTLGLIWTIILHFQISDVVVPGQEDITAKEALLLWSRRTADGYPGVKIRDFSSSWRDGRAFLSILHRNRPDLVDIRHMRQNSNKQNLESAFSIAEKEFGVTRLLDVDDVDVPNPDEKSIITYVSSLYDVFPEVPSVEQSLKDNERKLKVEEYRELASSLLTWIRDGIKLMLSRNYPSTLIEIKALQSDFNRFRNEEVPSKLEIRNRVLRLFDEIQSLTSDPSQMSIEDEFLPHNVSRMWSRFEAAMQERDMTLQAEVIRLERLHRLAEKAQRDVRYNEETLADLARRIEDTVRGLDLMHAFEAKRNCDSLDRGLKSVEESLRGLFRDCQTLQDGNHPHAEQLYRRVSDLQAKVSTLRSGLHSQVMHPLLSRSTEDGQGRMTKSRVEVVSEGRLMDTEPAYRHLQDCLEWIDAKQRHLEETKYDSDLSRVMDQLTVHRKEHEEIQAFRSRIDKCISDRTQLSSEEQKVYTQKLSKVEVAYSLLSKTSSSRLRCLESLSEFLQLATSELMWLREREETELSRDWSMKDLNLPELDEYHKSLVRQMESRESQFNGVQEKGGAMILDRHPSARTVEAYMSTLQSQWSWLVHLSWCLEAQIKHCSEHKNFFEETHHCEQWMARHSELLQNRFSSDNIPLDQAQVLLADLQNIQDQIREYDRRVSALVVKSRDIVPLKLRSQRVTAPIRVRTLCACHQQDVSLQRGEECFLVNNSHRTKWKVKTMTGLEVEVPSVCLLIPPPNQEAIDVASRLKLQHERLLSLWKTQQRKVRTAAICAVITQIKGWDLKKFLAMEPSQRDAVWHALKEDGQKLIAEFGTSDRDMRKLSEELKECEKIYLGLCEKAAAKEGKRSVSTAQVILQKVETASRELLQTDQQLSVLLHRPLPQNNLAVQESFRSYREFQLKFDKLENDVRSLQIEVKELSPRSSNIESKLNLVVQKADQMKALSHIYVDRLKGCEVVISELSEIKQMVTDFERSLAAHDSMTSDLSELKSLKNELVDLQESLQQHEPKLEHLKEDTESLRILVGRSRPGTTKHHDVDSVEKEVNDLSKRWDQICIQVVERLRSVGSCQDLLSLYHNGLHSEQTWSSQMEKRISSQPSINGDVGDIKQQLEPTMAIYNALGDRRYQLESVNRHGGQFIREAKISDKRLKQFKESVSETCGLSDVSDSKKLKRQDGSDTVRDELDRLNKMYMEMVDWANTRLRQITDTLSEHGQMQFQMVVDEEIPLLRTFRAELAKRSSMLMDADMREYFTQQFEGPAPSQASYGTTPEQLYKSTLQIRPDSAEFAEVKKVILLQPKSKQAEDVTESGVQADRTNPADVLMTLKAMESLSTLVPSAASPSKVGAKQQDRSYEQILVTVKKEEITPRGQVLHVTAIVNPRTSQRVTFVEALRLGLIDTKTRTFVDPSTGQRLPLTQASKKGYIDEVVLKQLTSSCGFLDPQTGEELSLLECMHKKLYDPTTNTFTDVTAGEHVSISEALTRKMISESCSRILVGETVELTSITRAQAVFTNNQPYRLETGLSLGKILQKGLCSEITGKVTEPTSGTDIAITEAVEKGFINPSYQEIKDPQSGGYITLTAAVAAGIVDPFKGTLSIKSSGQQLSLSDALSRGLVKTATSLADVVSQGNLTENGQMFDTISGKVMSLAEAIETGVISSNTKCILDPITNQVLTVKEAVTKGMMTPSAQFVNPKDKSEHPVLASLKLGIVKLVQEDIQFSRSGIKDPRSNEVVTLSEALKRGIITPQGSYVDTRTGREMNLQQAANSGLVDRSLVKDLNKPTTMKDSQGRNISIADALKLGIVDTKTGSFENVRSGERLTMQEATSIGLITASDATNVLSLLSPVMTSTTVLTQVEPPQTIDALTVSQAVAQGYLNTNTGVFTDPKTGHLVPLEEAIQKGLLKLTSEWPAPPPLSAEFDKSGSPRRILPETLMLDTSGGKARTIPIEPGSKKFESGYMTKSDTQYSFTSTTLAKPLLMPSIISETREINLISVLDSRTGRILDVEAAIKRGLISLERGEYSNPITGEKMPLNKAIERGFVKAEQMDGSIEGGAAIKDTRVFSLVGVLHPRTRKRLTVSQAISDGILDQARGVYNNVDHLGNLHVMKISEAIDKGYVIVEDIGDLAVGPDSMLRETKSYALKAVLHPVTGKHLSIAEAIAEGIINESEGLYINLATGETTHIHSAIEQGLILAELISVKTDVDKNVNKITTTKLTTLSVTAVVDPCTGKLISVSKAIEDGILNQTKGTYTNPQTGESMTVGDAIDRRLVLAQSPEALSDDPLVRAEISSIHITDEQESHETTLIEDIHSETVTMSITSVVNPKTMKIISYDEAVESGILNVQKGTYINPSNRETMTIAAALERGLIHGEVTSKNREDDIMRSSVSAAKPTFPLKDTTSVIDPRSGKEISFDKAVKDGVINPDKGTFFNSRTNTEMDLNKARELGYVLDTKQSSSAQLVRSLEEENLLQAKLLAPRLPKESSKPWSKVDIELEKTVTFDESMEHDSLATEVLQYSTDVESYDSSNKSRMLPPPIAAKPQNGNSGLSYMDGVKLGMINPDTGRVRDSKSGELLTLQEAMDKGIVDVNLPAMEKPISGQTLSLKECLEKNIIIPRVCKLDAKKAKQAGLSEEPLPHRVERAKEINIIDAVSAGLFNPITSKFLEPTTGQLYTLQEGLDQNFIDGSMVTVKDTKTGERVPLASSIERGIINRNSAEVYDSERRTALSLPLAIERSLVENKLDIESGAIIDSKTGQYISLRKAIVEGDLKSDSVMVLDTSTGEQVPVDVALRTGLVDRSGSVLDRQSGQKLSPQEALKMGLMAIVGAPIIAGKMVVDAVRDRNSSTVKAVAPHSESSSGISHFQKSSSKTVIRNSAQSSNMSRPDPLSLDVQDLNMITPVHFDGQQGSKSPTVGVVGKPVTITIDPGTPVPSSPQNTGKPTNITFQQKLANISSVVSESRTGIEDSELPSEVFQKSQLVSPGSKYIPKTSEKPGLEGVSSRFTDQIQDFQTETCRYSSVTDLDIDWETGTVIDKLSGQKLNVTEAVQKGLIDSELLENLTKSSAQNFYVNPEIIIDWSKGQIINQLTNETVSVENTLQRGMIDKSTASALTSITETVTHFTPSAKQQMSQSTELYTLNMAIIDGSYNSETGQIIDPASGVSMSVREALNNNIIDGVKSTVVDPHTGQEISLQSAINRKVFDPLTGEIIHNTSGERISLEEADAHGLIPDHRQGGLIIQESLFSTLTMREAVRQGYVNEEFGTFTDPVSGQTLSISTASEFGLIATSGDTDTSAGSRDKSSMIQAIKKWHLDEQKGTFYDLSTDEDMSFQEGVDIGSIDGKLTVIDIKSGDTFTLEEAIQQGKIDPVTGKYIDEESGKKMTLKEAAKLGVLAVVGAPIAAAIAASESLSAFLSDKGQDSRSDDIGRNRKGLVSEKTFKSHTETEGKIQKSQESTITSPNSVKIHSVIDPVTRNEISLAQAVEKGIFDAHSGTLINTRTGETISMGDALKQGLLKSREISPSSREAVHKGSMRYRDELDAEMEYEVSQTEADSDEETFHECESDNKSFDKGGHKGIISKETVLKSRIVEEKLSDIVSVFDPVKGDYVSVKEAVSSGLIDAKTDTYHDPATLETVPLSQALADGFVIGRVQERYEAATERGLADGSCTVFNDPVVGLQMSIEEAIEKGIVNISGKYTDPLTGDVISFAEAKKRGLVVSEKVEEVIQSNLIDDQHRDEGLVSNILSGKKMTLSEALHNGLVDSDSGLFHDPVSGTSMSVDQAILHRVVTIEEGDIQENGYHHVIGTESMNIETAITQGYLDTTTGMFTDPHSQQTVSISQALRMGLLNPTLTVDESAQHYPTTLEDGKDSSDKLQKSQEVDSRFAQESFLSDHGFASEPTQSESQFKTASLGRSMLDDSRPQSLEYGSMDGISSIEESSSSSRHTPLGHSGSQDRSSTPATPGRMADSYDKLVQDITAEQHRLQGYEQILKEDVQIGDEAIKIHGQLESHKVLHEEILSYQHPILSLVYQAEQLTELYQEELIPEQVTSLGGEAASLKKSLEKVVKTSDRRLKHLKTAEDELNKLEAEMDKFHSWKSAAKDELQELEKSLQRFEELTPIQDSQKELLADILSHQADIRYMSMSIQKYVEEAKLHKLELDSFRADRQRPARSSLISMDCIAADSVKDKLKDISDDYTDLKHRCSAFGDLLSELSTKQRSFIDSASKMESWLAETEDELASIKQESGTPDPGKLYGQLDRIKSLSSEVLSQNVLLDDLRKKGRDLTRSLSEVAADIDQVEKFEKNVEEIDDRYNHINQAVNAQAKLLQATITQSQDIQGAISDIQARLRSAQIALSSQQPISLELPLIAGQEQQLRLIAADVSSYGDSVESIRHATHDLIKSSDLHVARTLEQQLADIEDQYKKVHEACDERAGALRDVSGKLGEFYDKLSATQNWYQATADDVNSSDFNTLPVEDALEQLESISRDKIKNENDIVKLKEIAKELNEDPRTGSPASINRTISELAKTASQFDAAVNEKQADISQREKQTNEFESAKTIMLLWLAQMEARVDEFEPAAMEVDIVEKQIAELQPMLMEYEEQGPKVDEVNDLGNALEVLTNSGDRPLSPIRRHGRPRRIIGLLSPHLRSPSPTFPLSPTALKTSMSSESSGVSSRKSSSDNILLDDLSQTQQQLLDINQRYEILGERLADRQQELHNILASIRIFLQDMQDVLSWLDVKDSQLNTKAAEGIPAFEKEAKKKLKEHEEFHRELLNKEGLVEDIRKKTKELLKSKPGVPGLDSLQTQLTDLDEKWHGLRALSEEYRKGLEDAVSSLRDFREHEDQLTKWFGQKEKLLDVLGPVAMEPALLKSQMEQVKVLKEELASQEPTYDQFVHTGHTILDWCDASTSDSSAISKRMDTINKSWNKLQGRLKEREKNIESVQGLSGDFASVTRELANWLGDFNDRIDGLPKVSSQADKQQAQKLEMQRLQQDMQDKLPQISKAKDLCLQLCDTTKDLSTRTDLKAKMTALDKDITDTLKKLESRADAIEEASKAGEEFTTKCHQMLDWIQTTSSVVADSPGIPNDPDLLQKQVVDTKAMRQDLNLKEVEVQNLLDKGRKFIHEASPTAETRAFKETLMQMENEWGELKEAVKEREDKIKAASSYTLDFQQNLGKISWWLGTAEERLKKITPESLDKASIAAKMKELQSLQNEFLKKSHDHDNFNKTADCLLNSVDDPNGELQGQIQEVNQRWDALNSGLTERAQSLEELQSRLAEIDDNKTDLRHSLTRWEDKLAAHMDMGTAARDPKHIEKIKAMQDDISAIQPHLEYLDKLVEGLELSEDVDSTDLVNELKGLRVRYDQLQNEVGELISNMEAGSSIVGQFQGMMQKAARQLSDLDNDLANMKPVSRDEHELDTQLQEIQDFQRKLSDKAEPLTDLKDQAQDLQLAGFVSDPDGLNAQVESLLSQHSRLKERTDQRLSEIESNRDKVNQISGTLRDLSRKMDEAVSGVDSMKPIGSSASQIKEQQEELKKFSKSTVEPLQKELNSLNFDIEALIKSAPSGVGTGGLDKDLEALQETWSELSDKVSERERSLDKALLQSGKFKEAFASLMAWIDETEEAVATQKSASPELRVVKAQLQEQKLLQKMIDDRAPSVVSVTDTGKQLLSGLAGADHTKLDTELKSLEKRWAALTTNVTQRMKTLEDTSELAKLFQDIHEPLTVWLDVTDKKFTSLEPKSPNAGGIEKLIKDLKQMQTAIAEREAPVKELTSLGKRLQDFCKGEDVAIVQLKIDEVQKQFSDLKNKIDDSLEQMEEALPLAQNFQEAHEKFIEWVTNVESELRGKETVGTDTDEKVEVLLEQLEAVQPYLDIINNEGAELAEVAPGDAGMRVEEMMSKDNKRYDAVRQQIEKKAEKAKMTRQRSLECINELDELLDWFDKGEDKLNNMSAISADPSKLQKQLADIKSFSEEVSNQKVKARDAVTSGKKLLRDSSQGEVEAIQERIDKLKNKSQTVGSLTAERLSGLEQALPLAKSFKETHDNLVTWLDEVESTLADLEVTAVDSNQVRRQQESVKALKKDVSDHKPIIDRLNKTGSALVQLVSPDAALDVQNKLDDDNKRVEDVRNGVRERSNSIDAAMQQSAEFTDKLEDMLETLTTTAETIQNTEPISAHPGKIREQIEENKIVHEDMQMKSDAFESVKEAADELIKQAGDASDPAVRDVRHKLEELTRLYSDIQNNCNDRSRALDDALGVSEKFWEDLNTLSGSIKELQEGLSNQEKPALEPEAIREQQEELEAFRDDLATTQADLEDLQETGDQLMSLVGDPERPEVQKNLNDAEENLQNINNQVEQRSKDLDVALSKALTFQEELQKLLVWLQTQEDTLSMMEPIASDLETITAQWEDIKVFKGVVDPKHVEVEALNQQADELARDCTPEKAAVVIEPVREVNQRWDALQANIVDRQSDIQIALLNLGQFDQAYKDFRSWLENVDKDLEEIEPRYGDPKAVDMELAKLRVINTDIAAHESGLDLLSKEANKIAAREKASEAKKLKNKMEELTQNWLDVKEKAAQKQSQLENARREARGFTEELQQMMMKISDLDSQLITSQPVGGLPETAKEQLQKFMDIYEEVEKLEPGVDSLQLMSEKLALKSSGEPAANIRQNMTNLRHRWSQAMNRASDRKKKLEDAVGLAGNFHEELNKFIGWLTDTEKTLNNLQPVSRLVDKVTKQIEDHRVLQKDVSGHRESMFALDKIGTHLKYFSQKQDIVLIKNLLSSAQHRWEKIVSRSAERTRHLERGYKEAKQFYDSWRDLIQWLTEAEQALNSDNTVSNEPEKIKAQIAKHKEFQRRLGAKQPVYDSINRAGSTLQNRCPADDKPAIHALLADLKSRWNAVCGRSVDRQRKLEEGLLFTGQFNEALEALLEWLAQVEPTLAEDSPVHGDLDTVNGFMEAHKAFQQELGAKATTVQFVRKSAKDLIEKSSEDMSQVQSQLIELSTLWDRTCKLSVSKQERLGQAHSLADDFHNKAQGLLDWLANAERQLRFKGPIPDEEAVIVQQLEDHKKFEESMLRQEATLREALNIGQDIMKRCHPDAVSTMKHWLGVLRARWEELMGLSKQRQKRLTEALSNARLNSTLLEELLAWLNAAEVKLTDLNKEPIPKDLQIIQDLITEHQDFQNEMSSKQPSVDRLTKADKRKAGSDTSSHIPVFRGARNTSRSKIPTIRVDRVDNAGRKTPDFFGRKTPEHFSSHRTPNASGRKTPDVSGRRTPDHSGRRTPDHSSGRRTPDYHSGRRTPEPGFHNPRVGALFNKWRHVWLLAMYRQRKLQDALDYLNELERLKNFDFEEWRKRYLRWMNHNKARIMDFFRRQDHDRDGRVTRQEFIDGILQSKFPTSRLEMEAVADIFDKDGDGFINYKEFVAALRPDRDPKPETDSEKIMDEVRRQVSKCTCVKQFKIHKIGEGKYRFGDSQKLRLVRILRSTVMVRVGGGWIALDEFLVKNDPCRVGLWRRKQFRLKRRYLHQNTEESKGRTNIELREQFILAEGVSQSMSGFVSKSPASSSHSSGSSYSGKSASAASGPITKIREKSVHQTPWRQTKTSPDGEVHQIMSHREPDGTRVVKHKVTQELRSPRNIASPVSRSSSRASTASGSRPTSRTGSEAADDNQEVYTTVQTEKQNIGGRNDTTVTYQTHSVQTRNVTLPTVTSTKLSKIPKISATKKK